MKTLGLFLVALAAIVTLGACASVQAPPPATAAAASSPMAAVPSPPAASRVPAPAPLSRPDTEPAAPTAPAADLTLGPGDLLEISVFDVPELSNLKTRVAPSGMITLPLLGALSITGLTAGELQDAIRGRLQQQYMHDPQVSVFVTERKSQRIYVSGAVKTPGPQELVGRVRLADALALAGGLTDEAGRSLQLLRKRVDAPNAPAVATLIELDRLAAGDDTLNVELQGGDVVEVFRAGTYYVGGEVTRPGSFFLKTRATVAQAVVNAGGVKDVADWDDVRLYRRRADGSTEIQTFSLNQFEGGTPPVELQADDVVVVGKSHTKAFLYGVRDFFRFGIGASLPIL